MVFMGDTGWRKVNFNDLMEFIKIKVSQQSCKFFYIKRDFRKAVEGKKLGTY